jgi:hypothetical protein
MKINLALILSIIGAVGIVAFGFTAFQIYSERQQLNTELELKTGVKNQKHCRRFLQHPLQKSAIRR